MYEMDLFIRIQLSQFSKKYGEVHLSLTHTFVRRDDLVWFMEWMPVVSK